MADLISLIVSTYNRPDALGAVLRALSQQSAKNFEIIIADDGSGSETADIVAAWTLKVGVPLKHVWQEDRGFRLAEIRNRAIVASAGDYLVFLDGDCIARPDFIAAHHALAEPGYFVAGNRVLVSRMLTQDILANNREVETWSLGDWAKRRARGEINRLLPLVYLPLGSLRKRLATQWEGVRGGNFAFFRTDLDRVDGFETYYTGWGLEDSDIVIRMIRAGVHRKDGRFAAGVLHLWHPEADRTRLPINQSQLDALLKVDRVRALNGLLHWRRIAAHWRSVNDVSLAMKAAFDPSPWGTHLPRAYDRAVLALTRAMPANWLGLRLAILFRRLVMGRIGEGCLDTMLWGTRLRLYPRRNGCEKNALFTPQMFDTMERRVLAEAVQRKGGRFTFVDIGANVGLYSLYLASCGDVRTLAIEPQPGILERLRFHLAANPVAKVEVLPVALADRDGMVVLVLNESDSGGTHIDKQDGREDTGERINVPCRPFTSVLAEAGITSIDALKIDVEGAEDLVLAPFLRDAPPSLLPRLILIEDTRGAWGVDLFALLAARGYTVQERSRQNVALRLRD